MKTNNTCSVGIIFFVLFSMLTTLAQSQGIASTLKNGPNITWDDSLYDFGDMNTGDIVDHVFTFTNTGNEPLIITNVQVTCGCTTPKGWPKDPIMPGGKSNISITFNSTGKYGKQNKVITIISNSVQGNETFSFTANVIKKEGFTKK